MSDDVVTEHEKGRPLSQRHIDALVAHGVPPLALAKTFSGDYGFVLRDLVVMMGDSFEFGRFMARGEAVQAYTWLCLDQDGEPADIAAWRPPEVALWLGRVAMLGEEQVLGARLGGPLRVHPTVASWLRAGREGVYIVDYGRAADVLRCETLGVDEDWHARELRTRLIIPAPAVVLMQGAECAA